MLLLVLAGSGVRELSLIPASILTRLYGKLLNSCRPQLPHLQNGNNNRAQVIMRTMSVRAAISFFLR